MFLSFPVEFWIFLKMKYLLSLNLSGCCFQSWTGAELGNFNFFFFLICHHHGWRTVKFFLFQNTGAEVLFQVSNYTLGVSNYSLGVSNFTDCCNFNYAQGWILSMNRDECSFNTVFLQVDFEFFKSSSCLEEVILHIMRSQGIKSSG